MGHGGTWRLSRRNLGHKVGTPWMGCQPIRGHNSTRTRTIWKCQSAYNSCLWIGVGNRSAHRKPAVQGEHANFTHTVWRQDSQPWKCEANVLITKFFFLVRLAVDHKPGQTARITP
ncbi:hypothetical protein AMELA_G00191640 [Ameiurus melas]|uniref:Uncharacterized protein n=1 Tax=Ameiurus melas TaxID=219545 RepID=A0A7J6A9C2_AMEME|nr:hypothetical protein AMELA_G00191640 [Ameiurus melas]